MSLEAPVTEMLLSLNVMIKNRYGIVLLILVLFGCSPRVANLDAKGKTIVCFGDSITAGTESPTYPDILEDLLGLGQGTVVNAGESGENAGDVPVLAIRTKRVLILAIRSV